MNWIDFSILFVLILAFLNGFRRGFFKELSTLFGLILSILFTVNNADWLAGQLRGKLGFSPTILFLISFVLLMLATVVFLKILGHFYYKLVKLQPLKTANKISGGALGLVKGAIVVSLALLFFLFPTSFRSIDSAIDNASMAKAFRGITPWIYNHSYVLHPQSGDFIAEINKGIYLEGTTLAMTDNDSTTVARLNQYKQAPKAPVAR